MLSANKFHLLLLAVVVLTVILFVTQFRRFLTIDVQPDSTPLIGEQFANLPDDSAYFAPLGNPGAPITVVEFMNLNCKNCAAVHHTLSKFATEHPQDIRLFWQDAPSRGLWSDATLPHRAAYCAGKQNKLWPFVNLTFQDKNNRNEEGLKKVAEGVSLDLTAWWQCVNSDEAKEKIGAAMELAKGLGVTNVPAVFINNKQLNLAADIDLEELLKKVIEPDAATK